MKHSLHFLIPALLPLLFSSCTTNIYTLPSRSMEATLPLESKAYITETDHFKHNEISAYYYYGENYTKPKLSDGSFERKWQRRVSRIIALSGDTLQIKGGDIFISGKEVPHAPKSLLLYDITSSTDIDDFPEREADRFQKIPSEKGVIYRISLTRDEARDYSNRKPAILSVKRILEESYNPDSLYVRDCGTAPANCDHIGPIYIPRPGETVTITDCNRRLYANVPGIQPGKNVIKEKLYFMISDNWYGAEDSRYIGFIAESKMYGIVKE
jgi:signal peptidase I